MASRTVPDVPVTEKADVGTRLAECKGVLQLPTSDIELFILPSFLTSEECARALELVQAALKIQNRRKHSSSGAGVAECKLNPADPFVADLEDRVAELTGLDPLSGEPLQGLRFDPGREYEERSDWQDRAGAAPGPEAGRRSWTLLLYLNRPKAGGQTSFDRVGTAIRPVTGTLLAWNNLTAEGTVNEKAVYRPLPVAEPGYVIVKRFREHSWPWPRDIAKRLRAGLRFDGRPRAADRSKTAPSDGAEWHSATPYRGIDPVLALQRRDWMLSVLRDLQMLRGPGDGVPHVRGISSANFLRDYYAAAQPVVLEGEMKDWPALSLWSSAYLKRRIGSATVEYQGSRSATERFEMQKMVHKRSLPFDRYMDLIEQNPGNDAYITASNSKANETAFECLRGDMRPLTKFVKGGRGLIWIGPEGTFTPLHHDLTNNLVVQVTGSKRVVLLPPSETRYLYNHWHVFSAVHDITDEQRLEQFPLAKQATSYTVELQPGQILFVPIGWWHQVTALDFSVTFTFIDFHWKNDHRKAYPPD
jgi:hypothetical protein